MSLPTLLKSGSIVEQKWMTSEQKKKLKSMRSIDWIIEYLEDRSWNKTQPPKIKIKGPGSRVGVFRSGTGTGKSTVFPPCIFDKFFLERGLKKNIICTQPTVATATDIPYQIVQNYPNMKMGDTIGYQTGNLTRKPAKGVLFATVGILLQHLKLLTDEEFMRKYSFIILDEIHARSVEVDTTLFYIKRLLTRNYENPNCPFIILTSGTFEPDIFMDYFGCPKDAFLDIVGSSFPIQDNFSPFNITDYISYATDLAEKIHVENIADIEENKKFRDILIFVQGGSQIKQITERIHRLNAEVFAKGITFAKKHSDELQREQKWYGKNKKGGNEKEEKQYYICPISVTSDNMQKGAEDYQNLFADISSVTVPIYEIKGEEVTSNIVDTVPASRRLILGTNAIETGLTIDTLKYCIETGKVNESQFNPNFGAGILINKNVTQASSRQRRGRVGRKEPGVFYACYTKETYDALPPLPFPEIVKADITIALLDIIISETETTLIEVPHEELSKYPDAFQMNLFDQRWYAIETKKPFIASSLDFIQYPAADSITYGIEKLQTLGFIDHEYKPTIIGWYGSKFRKVQLENIRMILAGYHQGANILDLITITCFVESGHKLGVKKNKYIPRNPLNLSDIQKNYYYSMVFCDEFIEYLFIWDTFMNEIKNLGVKLKKVVGSIKGRGSAKTKKTTSAKKKTTNITDIMEHLENWCNENHFNYDTIMKIVVARDEMISDLLNIGLNPFYNGLNMSRGKYNLSNILRNNISEGLEEVRKIKQCIYEGYRMNLFVWNDGMKAYISNYGHYPVSLESKLLRPLRPDVDIKQLRPQKIIVSSVLLGTSNIDKGMYEFVGADISVLDGYVDTDLEFMMH